MKITFLGTGAADWHKKREGMTEFRRFSSALIDGVLLIDPGPHVLEALAEFGKEAARIQYIINTHKHKDHYCEETVRALAAYGASFVDLNDGDCVELGAYTVRAYAGNHSTCEKTVHFIISNRGRTLFYGLDGAWLLYGEVQAIKKYQPDFAVFDATIGNIDGDYRIFEHNNLHMVLEMKKTLEPYIGKFAISHMARTLHADHKTLSADMQAHRIAVAYDGWETEI